MGPRRARRLQWEVYRRTMPLLLGHNLSELRTLITEREQLVGVAAERPRSGIGLA